MSKGIATIIATIILVVITIGLISTAYLYFAGIVQVGPVLSVASAFCNSTQHIKVTLRNEGTDSLNAATGITWLLDGDDTSPTEACSPATIAAGGTSTCVISGTSGVRNILAIGPRNQAGGPVTCP